MTNDLEQLRNQLVRVGEVLDVPYWKHVDFWINLSLALVGIVVGVLGLVYAWKAYVEAEKAKRAATEAGKVVKIQTTTIELTEILLKLEKLTPAVEFPAARELLSEVSRRLLRATAPFANEPDLSGAISDLRAALESAKASLGALRNVGGEGEGQRTIYFAIEGDFSTITNIVAILLGLFENKNFKTNSENG